MDNSDHFAGDTHPDSDAIQRCVDGTVDPVAERTLIDHVQHCESCGDQVDRLRRVDAALALSSRPPADLLMRIKARRAAGERVLLPLPNVAVPAVDHRDERVSAARPATSRRAISRRNYAWPTAIAAALVCAISLRLAIRSTVDDPASSTDPARPMSVARDSTAPPAPPVSAAKNPGALAPEATDRSVPVVASPKPAAPAAGVAPHDLLLALARSALERVQIRFGASTPVRASGDTVGIDLFEDAFDGTALTSAAAAALGELGATLGERKGYELSVRPAAGEPAQRAGRVQAVVDRLAAGGIERSRIRQASRSSGGAQAGVVTIDVTVPR